MIEPFSKKASSKTLKQLMETELNSNLYLCNDFDEIEKDFLRLTKEWLTQKRQEKEKDYKEFGIGLASQKEYYQKGVRTIDELLEELKQ
jgi:adenine specific DNA methylase Mod